MNRIFFFIVLMFFGISSLLLSDNNIEKQKVSIIIKNGTIVTVNTNMDIIKDGVIIIDGNKIIEVGSKNLLQKYSSDRIIDADTNIVMPGMINAHNHLAMVAFRGLGEEGIQNRLERYFFPLEKHLLTPNLIYTASIHGCIDMALSGVTTYADMYYFMDEVAKATQKIGLRAVLGETVIGFPVADAPKAFGGLEYAVDYIKKYKNSDLITPALAPHAPYTVPKKELLQVKKMAEKYDIPILIHAAEFKGEEKKIVDNTNSLSVIKYLDQIGFLSDRVLLAHCNYADDEDIRLIKLRDTGVSHNPMSNAKGATGIADSYKMMQENVRMGLGTDGPMGSNQLDIINVMGYTSRIQRLKYKDETVMTPDIVVYLATMGGARALHMENKIGSLENGKLADIVIIDTKAPNMIPNYNIYATLVFQANSSNIQTTIVNGKVIVENRKLLSYDINKNQKDMNTLQKNVTDFVKELNKELSLKKASE